MEDVLFLAVAFFAAAVSATFGFGSAAILLPLSAVLYPVKKGIGLATVFFIVLSFAKAALFRRSIDWRTTVLFWIGAIPTTCIGAYFMTTTPDAWLSRLLGVMVLAYILNEQFAWTRGLKVGPSMITVTAGAHGFLSGLTGRLFTNLGTFKHL